MFVPIYLVQIFALLGFLVVLDRIIALTWKLLHGDRLMAALLSILLGPEHPGVRAWRLARSKNTRYVVIPPEINTRVDNLRLVSEHTNPERTISAAILIYELLQRKYVDGYEVTLTHSYLPWITLDMDFMQHPKEDEEQ